MPLVLVTLVVAVVLGWLRGGRLRQLADVRLRAPLLVLLAVGLQLAVALLSGPDAGAGLAGRLLLTGSQIGVLAFILANRALPGMVAVFLGFALNAAVIVANGAMPVAPDAIEAVSGEPAEVGAGKHRLLQPGDRLPWLADVLPMPPLRSVVSIGDIVLAAGVGILVSDLMRRPAEHAGREGGANRARRARRRGGGQGHGDQER